MLVANVDGGCLVGLAVAFFADHPHLTPEWCLVCVTGLLAARTTFSTFSAGSVQLLMRGRYGAAAPHSAANLFGSLVATGLGIATIRAMA